jgi:hypothetical protein
MTDITSPTRTSKQTGIVLGRDHAGIGSAAEIPVTPATPIVAVSPVTLSGSIDRIVDLELKVTAATTGDQLPIILYSHGGGLANYLTSYLGAGPLVDFWASHGFVVIQPTHLTSKSLHEGLLTAVNTDHRERPVLQLRDDPAGNAVEIVDEISLGCPGGVKQRLVKVGQRYAERRSVFSHDETGYASDQASGTGSKLPHR